MGRRVRPAGLLGVVVAAGLAVTAGAVAVAAEVSSDDVEGCPASLVPTAGFLDVVGHVHEPGVDCVVWHGLARGVTAGAYAPDAPVTRAQMSSFLVRLLEAAGVDPGAPTDQGFTDVEGSVHADEINRLVGLGVAQGTSPTTYDPELAVRRDQMATFLVGVVELVEQRSLPPGDADFVDIRGNAHEDSITRVSAAGLVRGTSATTYAPAAAVTRGQMATFLARVLDRFGVASADVRLGPRLHIGPGVSAEDEQIARESVEEAVVRMHELSGYATRDFDLLVHPDGDALGDALCELLDEPPDSPACAFWRQSARDQVGGGALGFAFTRTDGWADVVGGGRTVVLHEYVHVLQDALAAPVSLTELEPGAAPPAPYWLVEGQAMYLDVLMTHGEEAFPAHVEGQWDTARLGDPDRPALRDLEVWDGDDERALALMFVAVDVLIRDFGATFADHLSFYEHVAEGRPWQQSFERTFGVDADAFSAHVAALDG